MEYDYFIGMIKHYETSRVKAFRGQAQSASHAIPNAFGLLLDEVVQILHRNLPSLCQQQEGLVIFGLQSAGSTIKSNKPFINNRILDHGHPDNHFCCTLEFSIVPRTLLKQDVDWEETQSVIIDFTTGIVMDKEQYLAQLQQAPNAVEQGKILGHLNKDILDIAWGIVRRQNKTDVVPTGSPSLHVLDKRRVG